MENKLKEYIKEIDAEARYKLIGTTEANDLRLKAKIARVEIEFTKQQGRLTEEIKEMNKRSLAQTDQIKMWTGVAAVATGILAFDVLFKFVSGFVSLWAYFKI